MDDQSIDPVNYADQLVNNVKNLQQMALEVSKQGRKDKDTREKWTNESKQLFNIDHERTTAAKSIAVDAVDHAVSPGGSKLNKT